MKRLLLLLALVGMVAVGCTGGDFEDSINNGGNNTEQPGDDNDEQPNENEDNIPESIFFGLDKESFTISPDGGSVDVVVYSNYKWEISGKSDWCTPSMTKGDANEDGQKVTFSADVAYDDREATFWFRCADEKIKFVVSQKLKAVIISDENNNFNIPAEGGIVAISYKTSVDCEVIIPEEAQDWITITPSTRGLVSESINLDVAENTTYGPRSAVIKVVAKDNDELVVEYTINQEQNDAFLSDDNNTFTVPSTGGEVVIHYQTNIDCKVIIPEEAQDWITITPSTRGLVAYNTTLNVAANINGKQRSCVVKVVSQDHNELFVEYTLTQDTKYCIYYTSSNGTIVTPYDSNSFNTTILSNTYKEGVGVIEFDAPLTSIGKSAFYDCRSLTSVTIPDSVTSIGEYAFYDCRSLTSVTIPDSVTEIGEYAFAECSSLTSVTIGNGITSIGNFAFYGCSLTSVTIPDSVTEIGISAFRNCSSLQEFKGKFASEDGRCLIIEGVITSFAPAGMTKYSIPDSVTSIGNSAFWGCSSLTSVTIPDGVTEIGRGAFAGCWSLTSVTIPDSVTSIGNEAFAGCSCLSSVTIPDSVTEIGAEAFYRCSNLIWVTIGNGITSIGEYAFCGCSRLGRVTIANGVTSIGDNAFYGCSSLKWVYCKAITPPECGLEVFSDNASGRKIYVPTKSVAAYKAAEGWKDYASDIVGYDF